MAPRDWQQQGTEVTRLPGSNVDIKETRCLLFRKCKITGKNLFFKKAVCLTRVIHGPGTPVYLHYWIDRNQYLVLQLSGKLVETVYDFWE